MGTGGDEGDEKSDDAHVDEDVQVDLLHVDVVDVWVDVVRVDDLRTDDVASVDGDLVGVGAAMGLKNAAIDDGDGDGDGDGVFLPVFGRLAEGREVRSLYLSLMDCHEWAVTPNLSALCQTALPPSFWC